MALEALVLGLNIYSHHFNPKRNDLEDFTPGIYAIYEDFSVGVFKNSFDLPGAQISYNIAPNSLTFGPVKLELYAGIDYGYKLRSTKEIKRWVKDNVSYSSQIIHTKGLYKHNWNAFIAPSIVYSFSPNMAGRVNFFGPAVNLAVEYKFK